MQMFILAKNYYEDRDTKGVFTTVEKAKAYVAHVMNQPDLDWSDPSHNIHGNIWANFGGGHLSIDRVEVDPTS